MQVNLLKKVLAELIIGWQKAQFHHPQKFDAKDLQIHSKMLAMCVTQSYHSD
jgi:hypothetical protein